MEFAIPPSYSYEFVIRLTKFIDSAWLNAGRNRILGPSRTQEVQQGDSVALSVYGKYVDPQKKRLHPASFVRTGANTRMIQQLAEYGQNLRAAGPNEAAIANVIALVIGELETKPAPEAYMGYALYDADSNRYEVGKVVLSKKARNKHEELAEKIAITQDGYIETYLVNETEENVWFDQFSILSTGPLIVQETHYDPWGVELNGLGYQYGGIKVNPYLYNGKEANGHLGVNLYDFGARLYDPAIGRWFVVDPLAEEMRRHSPYNYAFNNPMRYIDPDGMEPYDIQGAVVNEPDEEDPTQKSVLNKEEQSPGGGCEGCASLPEVVVTSTRIIDFSAVRSDNYLSQMGWNNLPQELNIPDNFVLNQSQVIGGTVPFLPGGVGGWNNIKNFYNVLKNARSLLSSVKGLKGLPSLDATGKVHGTLPRVQDLGKYSKEELSILLKELRQSVQKRIEVTSKMGSDRGHGQRQGAEQDLIKSLEKYLGL